MAALLEYKCPCCGGAIAFDSATQKMKCPYCNTSFDVETLKSYDEELKNEKPESMEWDTVTGTRWQDGEKENMSVYVCDSCGGEVVGDKTMGATSCPYCGNPVVVKSSFAGMLRPDLVIPFKLDKETAIASLSKHFKGKILLPKVFKKQNHIEEIKGVYVPTWLFNCDVDADVNYRATRVRSWSDSSYNYTETSFYHVVRGGEMGFSNVPVDGSSKMPDDLMESLEPFNYADAVDFQTAYLAGYLADKYDVDADQSIIRANQRIKHSAEDVLRDTVMGYSTVTVQNSSVRFSNGSVRYALLPVWLLSTKWNDQNFLFAMNGQTGKFVGNLPMDKGAFWRWFLGIFGGVGVVASIIAILLTLM